MEETAVGSPDLRIIVLLRLLMSSQPTMASCRITPRLQWRHRAGLRVRKPLHQLPRHNRSISVKQPSSFCKKIDKLLEFAPLTPTYKRPTHFRSRFSFSLFTSNFSLFVIEITLAMTHAADRIADVDQRAPNIHTPFLRLLA